MIHYSKFKQNNYHPWALIDYKELSPIKESLTI